MPRMHGKSFADGETLVNADVHEDNVKAFESAGWKHGEDPDAPEASAHDPKVEKAVEKAAPKTDEKVKK